MRFSKIALFFLLISLLFSMCEVFDETDLNLLQLKNIYEMNISGASGISYSVNSNQYLVSSNKTNKIYLVSKWGEKKDSLNYTGTGVGGVFQRMSDSAIFVVEEQSSEVIELDNQGIEQNRYQIDVNITDTDYGLEGIAYRPTIEHFYLQTEKAPFLLIETDKNFNIIRQSITDFAKDFSDIFFDYTTGSLWIISDESNLLMKCTNTGELLLTYRFEIANASGILIEEETERVLIISNSEKKIYEFEIPVPEN